jgi:hypothetical protein
MSVALRMASTATRRRLGTLATAGTALVIALVAAAGEAPSRGLHRDSAWPFLAAAALFGGTVLIAVWARRGASRR